MLKQARPGHGLVHQKRECRRGVFQVEALFGLAVVGLMLGLLAVVAVRQNAALTKLNHINAAARTAEGALLALQSGETVSDATVKVTVLPDSPPAPLGAHRVRLVWVKVEAAVAVQGRETSAPVVLYGLVPQTALTQVSEVAHAVWQ